MDSQLQISVLLSALYELSLTIGATLDLETSCASFLRPLVPRMGLRAAAVWLREDRLAPGGGNETSGLRLFYSMPADPHLPERLPADHPAWLQAQRVRDFELAETDESRQTLALRTEPVPGTLIVYALGDLGLLALDLLESASDKVSLRYVLRNLVQRFAISLESCVYVRLQQEEVQRRRLAEEELRRVGQLAERANRAKSEFLASMSHEVRTPISAILGYAGLLERSPDTRHFADWTLRIQKNSKHLLHLVDDILDLAKVESRRVELKPVMVKPTDLLAEVRYLLAGRASKKGLELGTVFCHSMLERGMTDPHRVRQVVVNLATNAVKYTHQGSVNLISKVQAARNGSPRLWQIQVVDTGIGMTPEEIEHIFEPFYRVQVSTDSMEEGTGLGLYISKHITEMLGGTLEVHSVLEEGTTITLSLPFPPQEAREAREPLADLAAEPRPDLQGLSVLLVDDGEDNRAILRYLLEERGAQVETAEDGRQALERVLGGGKCYGLILMDMRMPVMDGFEATRELRAAGVRTPIIALTAYAMVSDRDRCLAAGCNEYLSKPVDERRLISHCVQWGMGLEAAVLDNQEGGFRLEGPGDLIMANGRKPSKQFLELQLDYLQHLEELCLRLPAELAAGNLEEVRTQVHRLKGSGVGFGFPSITHAAQQVEIILDSTSPLALDHPLLLQLLDQLRRATFLKTDLVGKARAT